MDWKEEKEQELMYGKGWVTKVDNDGFKYTYNEDYVNKFMGGGEQVKLSYSFILIDFSKLTKNGL